MQIKKTAMWWKVHKYNIAISDAFHPPVEPDCFSGVEVSWQAEVRVFRADVSVVSWCW